MNLSKIKKLIKQANQYDIVGNYKKADKIDQRILKLAEDGDSPDNVNFLEIAKVLSDYFLMNHNRMEELFSFPSEFSYTLAKGGILEGMESVANDFLNKESYILEMDLYENLKSDKEFEIVGMEIKAFTNEVMTNIEKYKDLKMLKKLSDIIKTLSMKYNINETSEQDIISYLKNKYS